MAAAFAAAAAGLGLLVVAEAASGRALRLTAASAAPLAFVVVALVALVPLPSALFARLDPAGADLLAGGPTAGAVTRPLSLDAPATAVELGKAAACLAVFLVAAHLAASRRPGRHLLLMAIGVSGVAAVFVGMGHRIWGASRVYGAFGGSRPFFNGPFVNPNHNAEFLELAAFVCFGCALMRGSTLRRAAWIAAGLFCASGALATLSRGSVLALGVGAVCFLYPRPFSRDGGAVADEAVKAPPRRAAAFWGGLALLLVLLLAGAFGASAVLERFDKGSLLRDIRFPLWRDALNVLVAHPLGIGPGAFDRVFPAYRTLETAQAIRFTHVENQPLQLLIEAGWLGFVVIGAGVVILVREVARRQRQDPLSVALIAGLAAVLVHNLVDFGLSLLGVALPFCAVLGTLAARSYEDERRLSRRWSRLVLAAALAPAPVLVAVMASTWGVDHDAALRDARTAADRLAVAQRASATHPLDYYYPLVQATSLPIVAADRTGASPRLHALNRALQLCPRCPEVHAEVARTLWRLGRRQQALGEWRLAFTRQRDYFQVAVDEVWAGKATAGDWKILAGPDPERLLAIASFLARQSALAPARELLREGVAHGASPVEAAVLRARLDLDTKDGPSPEQSLLAVRALAPRDLRIPRLLAEWYERAGDPARALQVIGEAAAMDPLDLEVARLRLALVARHRRWSQADRAVEDLKLALRRARFPTTEAHLAATDIHLAQGKLGPALGELHLAVVQSPENGGVLLRYADLASRAGRPAEAMDAIVRAEGIDPKLPGLAELRKRVEEQRRAATGRTSPFGDPGGGH